MLGRFRRHDFFPRNFQQGFLETKVSPSQPKLQEFVNSTPSSGDTEDGTVGIGSTERKPLDDSEGEDHDVDDCDSHKAAVPRGQS